MCSGLFFRLKCFIIHPSNFSGEGEIENVIEHKGCAEVVVGTEEVVGAKRVDGIREKRCNS